MQIRVSLYAHSSQDGHELLNPFQIIVRFFFKKEIVRLTFFTQSLTTRLIQKFMLNITSFVVACFINKNSSRMT
jgi:hypothetical protein